MVYSILHDVSKQYLSADEAIHQIQTLSQHFDKFKTEKERFDFAHQILEDTFSNSYQPVTEDLTFKAMTSLESCNRMKLYQSIASLAAKIHSNVLQVEKTDPKLVNEIAQLKLGISNLNLKRAYSTTKWKTIDHMMPRGLKNPVTYLDVLPDLASIHVARGMLRVSKGFCGAEMSFPALQGQKFERWFQVLLIGHLNAGGKLSYSEVRNYEESVTRFNIAQFFDARGSEIKTLNMGVYDPLLERVPNLFDCCPKLNSLKIPCNYLQNINVNTKNKLENLHVYDINFVSTAKFLNTACLPNLRTLNLELHFKDHPTRNYEFPALTQNSSFVNLRNLHLTPTDEGANLIANSPYLNTLTLSFPDPECRGHGRPLRPLTNSGFLTLLSAPNIVHLILPASFNRVELLECEAYKTALLTKTITFSPAPDLESE